MLPAIRGVIDRRILVNYRVDPAVVAAELPDPFRPQTVDGYAIGGICLIRLRDARPRGVPAVLGTTSENAAHRIAVEYEEDGETETGVYVPRRDSNSRLNSLVGGRLFAGNYHPATFEVDEDEDAGRYAVAMDSDDGDVHVHVDGEATDEFPDDSAFDSLAASSEFFRAGSVGFSPDDAGTEYQGVELHTFEWAVEPLGIDSVRSSYFEAFPDEAVAFDHALLMRGIDHEWRQQESLCVASNEAAD